MKRGTIMTLAIFAAAFFSGCVSTADRRIATSEESVALERIGAIDLLLLDYTFTRDPERLAAARDDAKEELARQTVNKTIEAALRGLLGLCELAAGNADKARLEMKTVESLSLREERLYLLRAEFAKDTKQRIETLEAGYAACVSRSRIALSLAELRYASGDYTRATALYDEALATLPDRYRTYYGKNRDLAYQFMQNPPGSADAKTYFAKETLTLSDGLLATRAATPYLNNVSTNKSLPGDALLELCIAAGYVYPRGLRPSDPFLRKDAAFFLLAIVSYLEHNRTLTTRYSFDYAKSGKPSPVPDVRVTDFYFDAVLVLVERELLDLPDGINFFPDRPFSGIELNEILKKITRRYNY